MPDAHDTVLVLHVAAGALGLALGPLAIVRGEPAAAAYRWAVLAVALTALALVGFDPAGLWWLAPLAVLAYALALLGRLAGRRRSGGWLRASAHGHGGSYIALVTALLVVSVEGPGSIVLWVLPTLAGVPLIEWWATRGRQRARA